MSLPLGGKLAAVLVPWVFLCVFATVYAFVLLPRMRDGAWLALCVGAFVAFVFVCFVAAAVTFSRDVLAGHWPE